MLHGSLLEAVTSGERAVKDELHRLVIVEETITVKALAEASGYTASSSYKALDRDAVNGLSFRILDAAALLSPEIASALVRLLTSRWEPRALPVTGADGVTQALRTIGRGADLTKWLAQALDDNKLDETEREETRRKLDAFELQARTLRAALDATDKVTAIGGAA